MFRPRNWARTYTGKKFDSGELVKKELPAKNAGDFQGYLINTRRDKFKDPRVREALGLALDFEWMNRQLFYNSYTRVRGFFTNSDFEAKGLPGADELALLEPLRDKLPREDVHRRVPLPPSTDPPGSLRDNLRKAQATARGSRLDISRRRVAQREGRSRSPSNTWTATARGEIATSTPYRAGLAKLGIELNYRRADFALIQKRLDVFDFDLFTVRIPGSESPGQRAAGPLRLEVGRHRRLEQSDGRADPAVDALVKSP